MTERLPTAPERVTVTHPMTRAQRSGRTGRSSARVDLREGGSVENADDLILQTLMRAQFSLALRRFLGLVVALVVVVCTLVLVGQLRPDALAFRIFSVPVVWWLLGAGVFPSLLLLSWLYVRRIERVEQRFRSLSR